MENNIISSYKKLVSNVGDIIEISGYRNDFIAKKMGLKAQTFSVKKQRATWTPDEIDILLKIVKNDEVENFLDKLMIDNAFTGKDISSSEFEKLMKWK